MISADFAPNESWADAALSIRLLFQPSKWYGNVATQNVREKIRQMITGSTDFSSYLFFTGRAAIHSICEGLSIGPGDEVIVQGFTCAAVVLPVIQTGATVRYADIEDSTFSSDFESLKRVCSEKTKLIILQHTFGETPKFRSEIIDYARSRNIFLVEDLAHGWNPATFSVLALKEHTESAFVFSFGRSKAVSSVFGGAVVTANEALKTALAKKEQTLQKPSPLTIIRLLLYKPTAILIKSSYDSGFGKVVHKIVTFLGLLIPEISPSEKEGRYDPRFEKSYPEAAAHLLLMQLDRANKFFFTREETTAVFNDAFSTQHSGPLSRFPYLTNDRSELLARARERNIYLGTWYNRVIGAARFDLSVVGYSNGMCPVAERIAAQIVNLPMVHNEPEQQLLISLIKQ